MTNKQRLELPLTSVPILGKYFFFYEDKKFVVNPNLLSVEIIHAPEPEQLKSAWSKLFDHQS